MQGKKDLKTTSIRYIKGVGPQRANLFAKAGIESVQDLFYYLPRRYEDRSEILSVKDVEPGKMQAVIGKVLKTSLFTARTGTRIFEMSVGDDKRRVFAVWYNQPFMSKTFSAGQTVVLYGKVEVHQHLQISHPIFEILEGDKLEGSLNVGRIVPIYPLTDKLSQKYLRKVTHQALAVNSENISDMLPTHIRAKHKLVDLAFAIENIHFPYSEENLERAYKRLIFEEFFILQTVMALNRIKRKQNGIAHKIHEGLKSDFEKLFSFVLTSEQKKCIKEIEADMSSEKPMYRLLQGDVGSGKTVVSMYALLLAAKGGHQAAMMVPTEILARQHYITISKTFMPLGLNVRLLVSGMDQASRKKVINELSTGDADIVIGTHALIQESVKYDDLALIVIDEQHKFGVEQRKLLSQKGSKADTLVMTATPIPRSLILTLFGDMDISLLKEKPEGREPVVTFGADESKREAVYAFIREEVAKGRQAFIVYPRIKDTALSDLKSAEKMYEHLKKDIFSDLRLVLIHGRLKTEEKDKAMTGFRDGKYDIMVATTVIEVGVDIPNVTVMMVEHAERYGLSQLHQLRGRIGRGKHTSYCMLMSDSEGENAVERIDAMIKTDDGFSLAEKDLDIRGPGEFLGTRQSGLPELKIGNISRDVMIMEQARKDAFDLVKDDPGLKDQRNAGIRKTIVERFNGKVGI